MKDHVIFFDYTNLLRNIPHTHTDYYNLSVAESTIPKAGRGIFVKKGFTIREGDLVCEYRGPLVPTKLLPDRAVISTEMTWDDEDEYTVLGENIAAVINDIVDFRPYTYQEIRDIFDNNTIPFHKGVKHNCIFEMIGGRIFIKAITDIHEGEELFISYGLPYWQVRAYEEGFFGNFVEKKENYYVVK